MSGDVTEEPQNSISDPRPPAARRRGLRGSVETFTVWPSLARGFLLALVLGLAGMAGPRLSAQTFAETKAFDDALQAFQDSDWVRADAKFASFGTNFTASERLPDAILFRAQALFQLKNFSGVTNLLVRSASRSGKVADQFTYWIGEAQYALRDYAAAAATFANLVKAYPDTSRKLAAVLAEADARAELRQWPRVVELLSPYQTDAQPVPADQAVRAAFLLSQAKVKQTNYTAAEKVLADLGTRQLSPELEWQRQYRLGLVQREAGRLEAASATSTNLLRLAAELVRPDLQAQSQAFRGEVLERLGLLAEAVAAYEMNNTKDAPPERQRQAAFKIVDLNLKRGREAEAARALEDFLAAHPEEKSSEQGLLSLAELRLKQYFQSVAAPVEGQAPPSAATSNYLQMVRTNLETFTTVFTNSPLLGKAQLDLGWFYLAGQKLVEAQAAFTNALRLLPAGDDQAVARFKLADILYQTGDLAGAISNYNSLIDQYGSLPAVRSGLEEQALYQILSAALEQQTNMAGAKKALGRILASFPDGEFAQLGMLRMAQDLKAHDTPAAARRLLSTFVRSYPDYERLPDVRLAIALTYERESDWTNAIAQYQSWIADYPTNTSLPRAEFCLAGANFLAGRDTNAFQLFSNFVTRFPSNELAAAAQYKVAEYFWNRGDYKEAEQHFQDVYTRWPASELKFQASLMAGKAAMARELYSDAIDYFIVLTSSTNCPPDLKVDALFHYADAARFKSDTNTPVARYTVAMNLLETIIKDYPTNAAVPRAYGVLGDISLALGTMNNLPQAEAELSSATNFYQKALDSPLADVTTRSIAGYGIGQVLEKMARRTTNQPALLLQAAYQRYKDVVDGLVKRPGETLDLFWLKQAGLEAGRLATELGKPDEAAGLYQRLRERLPSMEATLANRLSHLQPGPGK